jgi:hypothetical protein
MAEQRLKPLAALEAKTRQLLLMVGFGFLAFAAGAMLSSSLMMRLDARLATAPLAVRLPVGLLLQQLWIMVMLPAIGNISARFMAIRPWSLALIGGITGQLFFFAIRIASAGTENLVREPVQLGLELGTFVAGMFITAAAVRRGLAVAGQKDVAAKQAAVAKQSEYDEYLRAAEAIADRHAASAAATASTAPAETPVVPTEPKP